VAGVESSDQYGINPVLKKHCPSISPEIVKKSLELSKLLKNQSKLK
jgi:hypothetical protein